jgi:hypothetical protein
VAHATSPDLSQRDRLRLRLVRALAIEILENWVEAVVFRGNYKEALRKFGSATRRFLPG